MLIDILIDFFFWRENDLKLMYEMHEIANPGRLFIHLAGAVNISHKKRQSYH